MRTALVLAITLALAACGRNDDTAPAGGTTATTPPAATPAETPATPAPVGVDQDAGAAAGIQPAATATATLAPTEGHETAGTLTLAVENGGIRVTGEITGLNPNAEHAFHIHEHGDCSAPDASSAGGHFNPHGQPHGDPRDPQSAQHGGDMVNLRADGEGRAQVDARAEGVTIGSGDAHDVVGKAVIVHESPDDYESQPTGNAGGRWACGVIEAGTVPTAGGPAE
ncbi:superoxide dismutase family protein [Coralloluteibacterium thermophilus]|uniref:Superoxide dismutase [Cu-Zn] n=1 Tax=Coralloluteibacterium thermophilum TaxID=2707049 RepID=A0ABV9NHM0_9GAMM